MPEFSYLGAPWGLAYHPVWGSDLPSPDGFLCVLGQDREPQEEVSNI